MGGDGMQVQIDSRDLNTVYTGFQFGNYFRLDLKTEETTYIQPKHELGENPYRFNWQTPILLSPHNQDILYFGGNKLMRSMDKGNNWQAISPDLTKGGKKGNVAYGTLTSISESPFEFGLLVVGTDDGLVQVSRNGGGSWTNVSAAFPPDLWVSRVIASKHSKNRIYASLNGYRWDDFSPYVYISDDLGANWRSISGNLPSSPINVIKEDPANEDILYLGTDNGAWVSFNRGTSWQPFAGGLPNVAVHDLVIQEREKHLILGTHGRSFYLADVALLQRINSDESRLLVDDLSPLRYSARWGARFNDWSDFNEPTFNLQLYAPVRGVAELEFMLEDGTVIRALTANLEKGINQLTMSPSIDDKGLKQLRKKLDVDVKTAENGANYLPKGTYKIAVTLGDLSGDTILEIK
jgi:hypothetical protein